MDRIRFGHYLPHWLYVSVEELFKSSMSHHKCISYPVYCLLFYLIFLQTQVFFFSAMYSSSLCLHSRLLVRRMSPIWPACVVDHLINDSGWSLLLCPFISNALTQHTRAHAGFCNWWHDSVHLQAKRTLLFLSLFFFKRTYFLSSSFSFHTRLFIRGLSPWYAGQGGLVTRSQSSINIWLVVMEIIAAR